MIREADIDGDGEISYSGESSFFWSFIDTDYARRVCEGSSFISFHNTTLTPPYQMMQET